jgi:anti-anti-sigma regulatory factor
MDERPLEITHKRITYAAHIYSLSGELTVADALTVDRELAETMADGGRQLVVDLSNVLAAEDAALPRLLRTAERARELGAELLLATKDPWAGEYVVGPLTRAALERAKEAIPAPVRVTAA